MKKFIFGLILFCVSAQAFAQKGAITGTVRDEVTGEAIIGANVFIEGTTTGSATDFDGNFKFAIDPGTYTLVATFIGYANFRVTDLVVNPGEEVLLTIQLKSDDVQLDEVVVTAKADNTSEAALLIERRESIDIKQSIGAQELSRKGVSSVEAAVTQVTGVSKQQGVKNVFVRGLGDRYNSTSMNGLPLPSEDPAYKNITLDFFSTDIIGSIDVNKTFGSNLYGDVAGANINIVSKELFEGKELTLSISGGMNSQVAGVDFQNADGNTFFGANNPNPPITSLRNYGFQNSFQPNVLSRPLINSSMTLSGGKDFNIGSNKLNTFFVAGFSNDYVFKSGVEKQLNPNGEPRQSYDYDKYEYNTSHLGLANLSYNFGQNHSIAYNGLYIYDSRQFVGNYTGFNLNANDDITDPNAFKSFTRRQQTNNNSLFVNQLISQLNFNRIVVDLAGSYNIVNGDEPDRRSNQYRFDGESYFPNSTSSSTNHRFYSSLTENDLAFNGKVTYSLSEDRESNNKVSVSYNYRNTERDFENIQYEFDFRNAQNTVIDPNNPDAVFNQTSLDNGIFRFRTQRGTGTNALQPFFYNANRTIHAVGASFSYDLTDKLTADLGARYETVEQTVVWDTNIDEINFPGDNTKVINPDYFLPSLNLRYELTEDKILRFAASKSYTFPQFKEVAPFFYEDVTRAEFGNPNLLPSTTYNFDLKFENYFSRNELIAFTVFYKTIDNAINRVLVVSAANEMSFVNTGDAVGFGGEIEFRKDLFTFGKGNTFNALALGLNASYLYSNQQLIDVDTDELVFQPTNDESQLEGASPFLLNGDLTFTSEGTRTFTSAVVFSYFYDRIFSIGAPRGNQNIIERGVPTLDWVSSYAFTNKFKVNLNLKNLLNPEYRLTQDVATGNETISSYKRGMNFSVGLSYKF